MAEINGDVKFYPETNQLEKIGNLETDFSILGTISPSLDEFAGQLRILKLSNGNIFAKPLPIDLKFDDDIQLTVYNNQKVYKLLSSVIHKRRLKDENNKSKVYN